MHDPFLSEKTHDFHYKNYFIEMLDIFLEN